jgi:hypothetical protein
MDGSGLDVRTCQLLEGSVVVAAKPGVHHIVVVGDSQSRARLRSENSIHIYNSIRAQVLAEGGRQGESWSIGHFRSAVEGEICWGIRRGRLDIEEGR